MTAPLNRTQTAEFDPTLEQVAAVNVALPPIGSRTAIPQPAGDAARIVLGAGIEFGQVCVARQGDTLMISAQGYGQLVIQNSPANSLNPPELADSHGQVARAELMSAGCSIPGGGMADTGIDPASLAAVAPAASLPEPRAMLTGGHFDSTFDPAQLPGLSYGSVDPLAFDTTPHPLLVPVTTVESIAPETVIVISLDMLSNDAEADIPTLLWEGPAAASALDPHTLTSEGDIAAGVWSPLTTINNSLNGGAGSIAQVQFVVTGLGDGVALSLSALSVGWSLATSGIDADGNGTYTLRSPGSAASSAAFVSELAKLQIVVSGATDPSHPDITIQFTATDATGLTDTSTSRLDLASAGNSPPAPAEVHVAAGPLPPPSPTIEHLITP
jgi:hypothetical protein